MPTKEKWDISICEFPQKLFKWTGDVLNENNLKDLLLHDDGNSAVIVQTLLVKGTYFTDEWLNYFTNETRKQQIRSFFEKKGLELIQEKILSQKNKIDFEMYGYTRGLVEG